MSAIGPNAPPNATGLLTTCTQQITVGAADVLMNTLFNSGIARRLIPQAAGTVFIQRPGDSGFTSYIVLASVPIEGEIIAIGGTTNNPTASTITLNLEM